MTALEQLNSYLKQLELRFRLFALSRGAAIVTALALVLTTVLVWISNRYAFASGVVLPLRILLFLGLAVAISFGLAVPLLKLNRRWVTRATERRIPEFEQRLLTLTERSDPTNPFNELIAEDALRIARESQPEQLTPARSFLAFLGTAGATLAVLLWMIMAAPGYWGYGASLLWTGSAPASHRPLYEIQITPGNKKIRRKSDQLIGAELLNFSAKKVALHARYGSATKWDETPMQAQRDGNGFSFLFAGLSDPVEYYVTADAAQSKHFTINVKDLPGVKRVRLALHYPQGLGLKDEVQDPGGDVRAVQGSSADISVLTDRPLDKGTLVLDNGQKIGLTRGEGNWLTASLPIAKDGSYHVAALDGDETVRISDDYFIESRKDEAPSVKILRPGRDPKVSPIEEVPVTVEASDDFGLNSMDLHYSVNGGPEQVTPLLKAKGTKEASGKTMLSLENFKLVPGDLVSMYATARDAKNTSQSDILFAQAEPFDFTFRQSQQAGGGGGGAGQENNNISEREKEIIAATWNQLRTGSKDQKAINENAKFLSETQNKLSDQAKTLAQRMGSRDMVGGNNDFTNFSKAMNQASADMGTAVDQLKPGKWHDALPPEQKALQSLLRAEAIFRDIQVAFGQSGGGGGGGGAQRDLARMFDLELDTSKNQYETGQQQSQSENSQQKAIDEALQRLKDLAKRQQELAAQNRQQNAQTMQSRWEEEQLRREAEQLRQQMQQLAQNSQNGSQGQSSQSQSSQSQSSQNQGQQSSSSQGGSQSSSSRGSRQGSQSSGQQSGQQQQSAEQQSGQQQSAQQNRQNAEAMRDAMNALSRAEEEMRRSVSGNDPTAQRRAADQLAQAENMLKNMQGQQASNSLGDMANRAQQMASAQRDIENRLGQMYGGESPSSARNSYPLGLPNGAANDGSDGTQGMPQMPDPNARYGWRRRMADPTPYRQATPQEKALAAEKEKLAQQLEQLQKQMHGQAQAMAGGQPDVSNKIRKALSDAEQEELALRMQKNAEWLKQGYGERTYSMENSVTAGLDQLSRQLQEAQQAMKNGAGAGGQDQKAAEALSQVRSLREQLEQMAQARGSRTGQGQRGGQQGQEGSQQWQQGRSGQQGQNGGSQQAGNGSQQGGQQQGGQQGGGQQQSGSQQGSQGGGQQGSNSQGNGGGQQAGGSQNAGSRQGGQWGPGGANGAYISNDVQSTMRELSNLRNQLGAGDRQLNRELNTAVDTLGRLNNGKPGLLQDRLNQDAVASLERLELELSRRVGDVKTDGARTGANELAPEKYRDAVAEYFRKLSK